LQEFDIEVPHAVLAREQIMDGTTTSSCNPALARHADVDEIHSAAFGRSAFVTADVLELVSTDADELAERMLDWDIELKQLHPGSFDGAIIAIALGPVLVCHGHYNQSMLQQSGPPDHCVTIARPGRGSDPIALNGHDVADGEVFIAGPGAHVEVMNRGIQNPKTLSVQVEFLRAQAHWLQESLWPAARTVTVHNPGAQWAASYLDAMEWVVDAVLRYPQATARSDVRDSLVDSLLARVNAIGAAHSPVSDDRDMRAARRVAVQRAREYIHTNLTDPIRLSDLCKYARTQARALEYGFQEAIGASPIAYVRAMRLHRARRLLRSTAVRTRSISEIALDCGFWHLSQFAVDYKLLFAESPSVTYRRTQTELPKTGRRRQSSQPLSSLDAAARSIRIHGAPRAIC
jgi:AraC family ethanolamine operon transcriptional activator